MARSRIRPLGISAISVFFVLGAFMAALATVMLSFPGSALEPLWRLNPHAREGFASMGAWAVLLIGIVCVACATAAIGLWRCRRWGLWTAVAILSINLAGDTANALLAHDLRALIGVPIAAAMILYLLARPSVFAMTFRRVSVRSTN